MLKSRQSFLEWVTPKMQAVANVPILREPEDDWAEDCWRVYLFDENGSTANGWWTRVVQIDRYRSDGNTFAAERDCDALFRLLGFKDNQEALVSIPRYEYVGDPPVQGTQTGNMTLSLLLGRSWERNPDLDITRSKLRHYVLSLQLDYQHD